MIDLLCLITNYNDDKKIKPIYEKYHMPFNFTCFGEGTASSSILNYFGLEKVKKYIYFSLINNQDKSKILNNMKKSLNLEEHGKGIAFTIPLSSSTNYILSKLKDSKEVNMDSKNKKSADYHLIVTVISEGFAETVMNTAKKAGAGGGTLIRGRSLYQDNSKKQFLGFSIEPEKDVVLIVADSKIKNDVMNAIIKETGLKTKGGASLFTLPISDAVGIYE